MKEKNDSKILYNNSDYSYNNEKEISNIENKKSYEKKLNFEELNDVKYNKSNI